MAFEKWWNFSPVRWAYNVRNSRIYLDQPIGGHVSNPADSRAATKLGLWNSLSASWGGSMSGRQPSISHKTGQLGYTDTSQGDNRHPSSSPYWFSYLISYRSQIMISTCHCASDEWLGCVLAWFIDSSCGVNATCWDSLAPCSTQDALAPWTERPATQHCLLTALPPGVMAFTGEEGISIKCFSEYYFHHDDENDVC